MPDESTAPPELARSGAPAARTRLSDRQALAVIAGYFGLRQITTRVGLVLLPALLASAPAAIPLLRNTSGTVLVAGTAARGRLWPLVGAGAASVTISMIAAFVLYWTGWRFGARLAERGAREGTSWAALWNPRQVARAHRWLERWGVLAVAAGRATGPLNGPLGLVSGSSGMQLRKYAAAQVLGSTVWAGAVLWLGVRAGDAWPWLPDRIKGLSGWSLRIGLVSLVLLVAAGALNRGRPKRRDAGGS